MTQIKEILYPILASHPIDRAVLFGSYAKGTARPKSDIDLMIDSGGKIRGIDFFGVRADIREALNIPVDLIDTRQLVRGGRTEQEIINTGVTIYERA